MTGVQTCALPICYSGDITMGGSDGVFGLMTTQTTGIGAQGGDTSAGAGGTQVTAANNGTNADGNGAGGGGALVITSGLRSGGAGTAGMIIIDEYAV